MGLDPAVYVSGSSQRSLANWTRKSCRRRVRSGSGIRCKTPPAESWGATTGTLGRAWDTTEGLSEPAWDSVSGTLVRAGDTTQALSGRTWGTTTGALGRTWDAKEGLSEPAWDMTQECLRPGVGSDDWCIGRD